jgi:large conductance mechanosensitive channel
MWKEFKAFLVKDNIIGLAIAVILGLALNKLVTSVVDDVIMPVVNLATAATGGNWKDWYLPLTSAGADGPKMLIGNIIGNLINFVVIGLVCFSSPAGRRSRPHKRQRGRGGAKEVPPSPHLTLHSSPAMTSLAARLHLGSDACVGNVIGSGIFIVPCGPAAPGP